jgi:hypothetical protein
MLRTTPGQGIEPRSPRSERGVLPVRRSRTGEDGQGGPSVHLPTREIDAVGEPSPTEARVTSYDSLARTTSDVFQATRLPFDPGSSDRSLRSRCGRRPTWRGFGARASRTTRKKRRQKQMLIASVYFVHRAEGSFSLRRGLDSVLRLLQAEHHLSFDIHDRLPERRRRPVGSPSTGLDAARDLARTPPSEGQVMAGLERGIDVLPAQDRRGDRRSGEVFRGVDSDQHGLLVSSGREHRGSRVIPQGFQRKIRIDHSIQALKCETKSRDRVLTSTRSRGTDR